MRSSTVVTTTVVILVGAAIASPVPAAAQAQNAGNPDRAGSAARSEDRDSMVLRRDGDRAVPVDPVIGGDAEPALRRDGSKAIPFVADVGSQTAQADSAFHWGDALIGAGVAVGLMMLASIAWGAAQRRRRSGIRPARAA